MRRVVIKTAPVVNAQLDKLSSLVSQLQAHFGRAERVEGLGANEDFNGYDFSISNEDLEEYGNTGLTTRRMERAFGHRAIGLSIPSTDGLPDLLTFLHSMYKRAPKEGAIQEWIDSLITKFKSIVEDVETRSCQYRDEKSMGRARTLAPTVCPLLEMCE